MYAKHNSTVEGPVWKLCQAKSPAAAAVAAAAAAAATAAAAVAAAAVAAAAVVNQQSGVGSWNDANYKLGIMRSRVHQFW